MFILEWIRFGQFQEIAAKFANMTGFTSDLKFYFNMIL